jgi:hypothetical protein
MPGGYLELVAVIGLYAGLARGRQAGHARSQPRSTSWPSGQRAARSRAAGRPPGRRLARAWLAPLPLRPLSVQRLTRCRIRGRRRHADRGRKLGRRPPGIDGRAHGQQPGVPAWLGGCRHRSNRPSGDVITDVNGAAAEDIRLEQL